jgi:hypothetical protein
VEVAVLEVVVREVEAVVREVEVAVPEAVVREVEVREAVVHRFLRVSER